MVWKVALICNVLKPVDQLLRSKTSRLETAPFRPVSVSERCPVLNYVYKEAEAHRSPQPLRLRRHRRGRDDRVRHGHQQPEEQRQQRPHRQQRVRHERQQQQLPNALLRTRGARHVRERAAQHREGEAEEQAQVRDLLQLGHLQVFDVGDDEERDEDDEVHRVRALGDGEAGAGQQQLQQAEAGGQQDEHGQRLQRGGLLEPQVVVVEERLELLAVELVLARDDPGRTVALPAPGLDFLERHFVHGARAIHAPERRAIRRWCRGMSGGGRA